MIFALQTRLNAPAEAAWFEVRHDLGVRLGRESIAIADLAITQRFTWEQSVVRAAIVRASRMTC
jgi:hypothetical protein